MGAVLYEALTGERPELMPRAAAAKRLAVARRDLPRSLRDTICSLLAESPSERPDSAQEVLDALEPARVYRTAAEGLVPWADTLPFPLASVLWHYEAEPDEGPSVEYLLKFFEALAQFTATVLLSACITDRGLFAANRPTWTGGSSNAVTCNEQASERGSNWRNAWHGPCGRYLRPRAARNGAVSCSRHGTSIWSRP